LLSGSHKFYEMTRDELTELMQKKAKRMAEMKVMSKYVDLDNMETNIPQLI